MIFNNSTAGSRRRLAAALIALAMLPVLFGHLSAPATSAQVFGVEYIFDVVPDAATLATLPPTGTTFYLQGKVYPFRTVNHATCQFNTANPRQIGTWRAWGQVADDGRLVLSQSLVITSSRGTIEAQGVTGVFLGNGGVTPAIPGDRNGPTTGPTEIMAVTGGAGIYRALNGEAQIRPYCSDPSAPFRYDRPFCFQVIEGKRKYD